ncbi:MAG: nickel-dependent lactate racemase, partial [Candidatus Atribacteria bacterium]|nr:nickel-dependent lactate racemase [Candidatus Atribacteria bacterium]
MTTELKYGDKKINLALDSKNLIGLITARQNQSLENPLDKMRKLLDEPINSPSLKQLIKDKKAKRILIVANDITRPTPYDVFLPPLLDILEQLGIQKENITFIVATGAHRGNTKSENKRVFGKQIVLTYHFINHDCDDQRLIDLGKMKSGNHLWVDPVVKQVDFIITTGVIVPHYIAGFSGGRKSILPGICGRETIEKNHANMIHPQAFTGNLLNNPVHQEMMESIQMVSVDFNINAITDEEG